MMNTEALPPRNHNRGPTSEADELLEAFERAPETLDRESAERAVTLAKQMKLAGDELAAQRKTVVEPLRRRIAETERPYKDATDRLGKARGVLLVRLKSYLDTAGLERLMNALGLQAYRKRTVGFVIEDQKALPRALRRTVPDEEKIERALREGQDVPGVRRTETVQIIVT